jgi:hypothetical protein
VVRWFHLKVAAGGAKVQKAAQPLPICGSSVISPTFAARLNKGCRGGDPADSFEFSK